MAKRLLEPNEECPCTRGRLFKVAYRNCCQIAHIEWFVDETDDSFSRHAPQTEGAAKDVHGPSDPDEAATDPETAISLARWLVHDVFAQTARQMITQGYTPDWIYAYLQTGCCPNQRNTLMTPRDSLLKWAQAMVEYRMPQSLLPLDSRNDPGD